jgi:hypothetical protein
MSMKNGTEANEGNEGDFRIERPGKKLGRVAFWWCSKT